MGQCFKGSSSSPTKSLTSSSSELEDGEPLGLDEQVELAKLKLKSLTERPCSYMAHLYRCPWNSRVYSYQELIDMNSYLVVLITRMPLREGKKGKYYYRYLQVVFQIVKGWQPVEEDLQLTYVEVKILKEVNVTFSCSEDGAKSLNATLAKLGYDVVVDDFELLSRA